MATPSPSIHGQRIHKEWVTVGIRLVDRKFNQAPGFGRYNLCSPMLYGPMFAMGKRFYKLHEQLKERRYSKALKCRPNYRQGPHGLPATNSRGGKHNSRPTPFVRACEVLIRLEPHVRKRLVMLSSIRSCCLVEAAV
jgi:hypothetical protein